MSILAGVLAFNCMEDLEKCFISIINQDSFVDLVLCIDNSDSDYKKMNYNIVKKYSNVLDILYYDQTHNVGSAKGFAMIQQFALDNDYSWVWLLDQDGFPEKDCLRKLIEAGYNKEQVIIAPRTVFPDGSSDSGHSFYYRQKIETIDKSAQLKIDVIATRCMLVSLEVIRKIGIYDYNNCYIGNEDYEFCLRNKSAGGENYVVIDAICYHPHYKEKYLKVDSSLINYLKLIKMFRFFQPIGILRKNESHREYQAIISMSYINWTYQRKLIKYYKTIVSLLIIPIIKLIDSRFLIFKSYSAIFAGIMNSITRNKNSFLTIDLQVHLPKNNSKSGNNSSEINFPYIEKQLN